MSRAMAVHFDLHNSLLNYTVFSFIGDFGAANVTVLAGETTARCLVPIVQDNIIEDNEMFDIRLLLPVGMQAILGSQIQATGTILENDGKD